nr:dihydropteroate synthase [Jeotgalicoccus pinnipedialis]
MGILNVTPDSFSDGGKFNALDDAVSHAKRLANEGANIIDVGGYSTRPGYTEITLEEEISRVVPVVERIANLDLGVDISVDTFRSEVAEAVLAAGATMINDQWRGTYDDTILDVVKKYEVPIILMHNNSHGTYESVVDDMIAELMESVQLCKDKGIEDKNIWLDPGIGFQKSRDEEIEVMRNLDKLVAKGYKVLLATSRKRMVKELIGTETSPEERDPATAATTIIGINQGVHGVRVHNVAMNRQIADVYMKLQGDL